MTTERRPDDRAVACASSVASGLRVALRDDLLAVYLHGSAVLGGFRWDRSDLDVLVLTGRPLTDAQTLAAAGQPCVSHLPRERARARAS